MHVSQLSKNYLPDLFKDVAERCVLFRDFIKLTPEEQKGKILFRHDVDDDLPRSVAMAELQHKCGVKATYFILDTAPYWVPTDVKMWRQIHRIKNLGHEVAWHNNVLSRWVALPQPIEDLILEPLNHFALEGIKIHGSASHGDPLCYKHGFVNYEVFAECGISKKSAAFAEPTHVFPKVSMKTFGLQYEAYHLPKDQYFSESGGNWGVVPDKDHFENRELITQILIHPQWWTL